MPKNGTMLLLSAVNLIEEYGTGSVRILRNLSADVLSGIMVSVSFTISCRMWASYLHAPRFLQCYT